MAGTGSVWTGHVTLPNDIPPLQHITLTASSNCKLGKSNLIPKNATLSFLDVVVPSRIPLYLAAGPSLDVWTEDPETESWFWNFFLQRPNGTGEQAQDVNNVSWCDSGRPQSDFGILLRIEHHEDRADLSTSSQGPRITELLLYGKLSDVPAKPQLPTPPSSSSPAPVVAAEGVEGGIAAPTTAVRQLTIHALPLSSELLYSYAQATAPIANTEDPIAAETTPETPESSTKTEAHFLPPIFQQESRSAAKRKRTEALFNDAAEKAKKARRSGGDAIAQAMAEVANAENGIRPSTAHGKGEPQTLRRARARTIERASDDPFKTSREGSIASRPQTADGRRNPLPRPGYSRSPSIASTSTKGPRDFDLDRPRPPSRKSTLNDPSRRSLLSRVSSSRPTLSLKPPQTDEPLEAEGPKSVEALNKEAISRAVMAGMRMYGLKQRKRRQSFYQADNDTGSPDADEYKLVYHQAFKGACFAFRRTISTTPLNQDQMRDVVDKLLAIFCNDPLLITVSVAEDAVEADKSPFAVLEIGAIEVPKKNMDVMRTPQRGRKDLDARERTPPPIRNLGVESPLMRRKAKAAPAVT